MEMYPCPPRQRFSRTLLSRRHQRIFAVTLCNDLADNLRARRCVFYWASKELEFPKMVKVCWLYGLEI